MTGAARIRGGEAAAAAALGLAEKIEPDCDRNPVRDGGGDERACGEVHRAAGDRKHRSERHKRRRHERRAEAEVARVGVEQRLKVVRAKERGVEREYSEHMRAGSRGCDDSVAELVWMRKQQHAEDQLFRERGKHERDRGGAQLVR
eukprot:CAMPEP_0185840886 /NCGR_PEP_ID=MMETSP1353-20130828/16986_1 /TAXON_ID=1077150 /ORGANISM="Erythrolobus australicus, Strain CCMP3124" /LENGTH=145 /DNA_ID=CAMNT_0028540271 /DNA_START=131 /DNA_END=565 /DNA_ORIENTATION=-